MSESKDSLSSGSKKSLFRRVTKGKDRVSKTMRKRDAADDVEEVVRWEDEESSTTAAIQQTKKKRKILNSVLYKRGLDSRATLDADPGKFVGEKLDDFEKDRTKSMDPDRLRAFSGGTCGMKDGGNGEGVMQMKHKEAMEEFIRGHLTRNENNGECEEAEATTGGGASKIVDLESKLYQELAETSERLSGTVGDLANEDVSKEEDVGAGGAMLGGTGLAEVILPSETRLETVKATEQARRNPSVKRYTGSSAIDASVLPTTFSVGKGKRERRQRSLAANQEDSHHPKGDSRHWGAKSVSSDVPSSYSQSFSQIAYQRRKAAEQDTKPIIQRNTPNEFEDGRVGFEAARRSGGERKSRRHNPTNQASDTRVFRQFVKTERERGF